MWPGLDACGMVLMPATRARVFSATPTPGLRPALRDYHMPPATRARPWSRPFSHAPLRGTVLHCLFLCGCGPFGSAQGRLWTSHDSRRPPQQAKCGLVGDPGRDCATRAQAAAHLGLNRTTLISQMKRSGVDPGSALSSKPNRLALSWDFAGGHHQVRRNGSPPSLSSAPGRWRGRRPQLGRTRRERKLR